MSAQQNVIAFLGVDLDFDSVFADEELLAWTLQREPQGLRFRRNVECGIRLGHAGT